MSEKDEWENYLGRFMKAFNALPEVPPILKAIAPVLFQYQITDRPEMNFWQLFEEEKVAWGMGENKGTTVTKIIHKADFDTVKKVHNGETDPIQATMAGKYVVEGDLAKLMECSPILPLNPKAHIEAEKSK